MKNNFSKSNMIIMALSSKQWQNAYIELSDYFDAR